MSDDFLSLMQQKEYAYQLFGRSKFLDINEIKDVWESLLDYSLQSLSNKLKQKFDPSLVEQATKDLRAVYMNSFDRHRPELEAIVQEYFTVHESVLLPEDQDQEELVTDEDERALDSEIRRHEAKLASLNAVDNNLKALLKSMAALKDIAPVLDENTHEAKRIGNLTEDLHKEIENDLLPLVDVMERLFEKINLE